MGQFYYGANTLVGPLHPLHHPEPPRR